MAEAAAELEIALADAGLLLVELEKFRTPDAGRAASPRSAALGLGDRARRLHRAGALDERAAAPLLREARSLLDRLRAELSDLRAAPAYRAAVAAHRGGDHAALATLLPAVLDGLEPLTEPPAVFRPVPWLRRNRPRPPTDIAADVLRLRETGVAGEGDAAARGVDPALPAVAVFVAAPVSDPVSLRYDPGVLPPAVFRMRDTGELLIHVPVLRAPFAVQVASALDLDEVGEIAVDFAGYRASLQESLDRLGLPVQSA